MGFGGGVGFIDINASYGGQMTKKPLQIFLL
jgi:hypothetical protein